MRSVALVALLLVACSKREAPRPQPVTSDEAMASASASVKQAPPQPTVHRFSVSGARFANDELDECIDIVLETNRPATDGGDPLASFVTNMKKEGATPIGKPCGESFANKTPLASCRVKDRRSTDAGAEATVTLVQHRYRFADVGLSDRAMKECIESEGEWKALDPESDEWRRAATLEQWRKPLQGAADRLGNN